MIRTSIGLVCPARSRRAPGSPCSRPSQSTPWTRWWLTPSWQSSCKDSLKDQHRQAPWNAWMGGYQFRYEEPKKKQNIPNRSWRRTPRVQMMLKEDVLMEWVTRAVKAWVQHHNYLSHINNLSKRFQIRAVRSKIRVQVSTRKFVCGLGHAGMKCIVCVGKQVFWRRGDATIVENSRSKLI